MRRSLTTSRVLCALAVVAPALAAAEWTLDILLLPQRRAGLPGMQPNTAAGLVLAAATVMLTPASASTRARRPIVLVLASTVLLLGVVTLGEYAFGWDAGIDRLLFADTPTAAQPYPGRPSPQAALSLALFGAALISFNLGSGAFRPGQISAIVSGANAIAAATSYIFGAPAASALPLTIPGTAMDVGAAFSFVLLVSALFCRRPEAGIMTLVTSDTRSGAIARRILLAGIVAPPLVGAVTRFGVLGGWYGASAQGSLFVLILAALILRTTWRTVQRSDDEELKTRAALSALEHANREITRLYENASRLDELKTRLFADVSHELRTPLTLLLAPIEKRLDATQALDRDLRRDLEVMAKNARSILRHVNDLLDVARLDAGRLTPDYADTVAAPIAAPEGTTARRTAEPIDPGEIGQQVDELRTPGTTATATSGAGGRGRVLVVDDDREMNRFIVECLGHDGFEVASASDGHEGFERAVAEPPDLVLISMMSPAMPGDEFVRRFRARAEFASIPIVVLTSGSDTALRVRLLDAGAQDYLDKPFSVAELRARVRNLVARKRALDDVDRLRREVEALARAGNEIADAVADLPAESVRTVLQTIALNARTLTGAELAAAGFGGDETRPFDIWAHVGLTCEQVEQIGRPPRHVGVLGLVAEQGLTIRARDIREHPMYRGLPAHHPPVTSFLAVPIRFRGQVVGNLYLGNKRGGTEFTLDDQHVAEMLAARAGSAVETSRLYAAEGRAHAWLQAVVDQMPEGIVLMDAQGRVTLQNRSLHAFMHATPGGPDRFGNPVTIELRKPYGERLGPDDLPSVRALLDREVTVGREFIARGPDDRLVPVLVSAAPILTEDGSLAGAVMMLQDISTLKELERLREEWASIVAHDLRQPISVIALRTSLLLRGRLTQDQRDGVEQIATSIHALSRMVSDLMDASLLESDRLRVTLDRLDLGQLLHDVVERVPLASLRTRTETPRGLRVFVKGDAQRLEQVLSNLLSNALKYAAPDTGIHVSLSLDGDNAHVSVANHGAPIPEDELPLVFHRFARSRSAESSAVKGLGLGLYVAKGLITAHRGRIWAESESGLTVFHFTIPLDGPPVAAESFPNTETSATPHAA